MQADTKMRMPLFVYVAKLLLFLLATVLVTTRFCLGFTTVVQRNGAGCVAFTPSQTTQLWATTASNDHEGIRRNRRSFIDAFVLSAVAFTTTLSMSPLAAFADQQEEFRQGIKVNAFNGLIFNYRGNDFGGLAATDIDEPSVSYAEFNQRLKAGDVAMVEFNAPDGDQAYVTFKNNNNGDKGKPIRIGEGYPIERHDGYSSPLFCIRAVKDAGVPYKFVVPSLASYK